ncbi:MAG: single-stranded DNA-binding protein, partial [Chloroflexi bacterium]|nr:single-stranded DNA-binding protein [Chloroflexota bacterium]
LADATRHLAKGRLVHVAGRLRTDEWQDEAGKPHSRVKVVAQRIDFLDAPPAKPAADAPRS